MKNPTTCSPITAPAIPATVRHSLGFSFAVIGA